MRYIQTLPRAPEGRLNDFLSLRDGRLVLGEAAGGGIDLLAAAEEYGTPLEIAYCPQITRRVEALRAAFAAGVESTGYRGTFHYAYATKANVAAEVIETVVAAGVNYETSSATDVAIAHGLWRRGLLAGERYVFCNGSKDTRYIAAIRELRAAGFEKIVPILDDPAEFEALAAAPQPLLLGVRARVAAGGADRFGMWPDELEALAARIAETPHRLVLYHAMLGSQIESPAALVGGLAAELGGFARLRARAPHLHLFNFGGGMPTPAYRLDAHFDYANLAADLLEAIGRRSDELGIPHPAIVGEFGRYTVADHGALIFRVGRVKPGGTGRPAWYLIDGSLMVNLPDILIVDNQTFITLALNHHDRLAVPVVLGGRHTCDSDDYYPRKGALLLPDAGEGLYIAFFGTGAYQAMLSGEGGAHHCLTPEARKLIVRARGDKLEYNLVPEQHIDDVLGELGFYGWSAN